MTSMLKVADGVIQLTVSRGSSRASSGTLSRSAFRLPPSCAEFLCSPCRSPATPSHQNPRFCNREQDLYAGAHSQQHGLPVYRPAVVNKSGTLELTLLNMPLLYAYPHLPTFLGLHSLITWVIDVIVTMKVSTFKQFGQAGPGLRV